MGEPLLSVCDLGVSFGRPPDGVPAVIGADLTLDEGEILGIVGESGSGKSTLMKAILRILEPPGVITSGSVRYAGREVLTMSESELRAWRWESVAWVPQSALMALNPVLTVGQHFDDTLRAHGVDDRGRIREVAEEMLGLVDLDGGLYGRYPHTLSGGMRQRVAVALALALEPRILVLDEPTTALDVVVERELLQRVLRLQRERGFGVIFITHDLKLLLELADRVAVMYSGHVVETAPVEAMREHGGRHPYSQGLVEAAVAVYRGGGRSIPGQPASLASPPSGCRFHPRCGRVLERCRAEVPALRSYGAHRVACHAVDEEGE